MNVHERLGARRLSPARREFYIDGITYHSSASDFRNLDRIIYKGDFSKVSVKLHIPSNKEIIEKKIRKKENCEKYVDIERDMINISNTQYIVDYFGYLEDQVDMFLYMEKMECCFRQLLDRVQAQGSSFPALFLASVTHSVTEALLFLKEHNILHRDIKPSNILLNRQGQIKLGDFGLSKESEDGTAVSKGIGTYEYNAPERLGRDRKHHSYPSDVWSLGITLVELATLVHPIRSRATNEDGSCSQFEMMIVVKTQEPPSLTPEQSNSPHLCSFVTSCLKMTPEERIQLEPGILNHPLFYNIWSDRDIARWYSGSGERKIFSRVSSMLSRVWASPLFVCG